VTNCFGIELINFRLSRRMEVIVRWAADQRARPETLEWRRGVNGGPRFTMIIIVIKKNRKKINNAPLRGFNKHT